MRSDVLTTGSSTNATCGSVRVITGLGFSSTTLVTRLTVGSSTRKKGFPSL